ncbi:MAG TPA: DUF2269 family protein [Anaerolineales bacterium]|nr:DUF2269 family protein [Anaerolineales bacterium]
MNYYLIAKFVHIVGALGMFVVLGVEWLSLWNLRHARSGRHVHEWLRVTRGIQRLGGASMVAILVSGFYMMAVARIGASWLIVSFWSLILTGLFAGIATKRPMRKIQASLEANPGEMSPSLSGLLRQPLLWIVMQTRVGALLGVVFLMTAKPDLFGSLLTMGIAVVLGFASALLSLRGEEAMNPEPELQ